VIFLGGVCLLYRFSSLGDVDEGARERWSCEEGQENEKEGVGGSAAAFAL
jgi:hypothetical protein